MATTAATAEQPRAMALRPRTGITLQTAVDALASMTARLLCDVPADEREWRSAKINRRMQAIDESDSYLMLWAQLQMVPGQGVYAVWETEAHYCGSRDQLFPLLAHIDVVPKMIQGCTEFTVIDGVEAGLAGIIFRLEPAS